MERAIIAVIAVLVGLVGGAVAGYFYFRYRSKLLVEGAEQRVEHILADAETQAKDMLVQARDQALKQRNEAEQENQEA